MSFEFTSRNISIKHNILKAECRDINQNWKTSSLDLDQYIGNLDGTFALSEKAFSRSASNIQLDGAILYATLLRRDQQPVPVNVDLNICVANINGNLEFQKPNDSLLNCGSCFSLEESRLKGLCMGYDKRLHVSEIDLNEYFENTNGELDDSGRNFYSSSRKISIEPSSRSLLLKAELKSNHWISRDFWKTSKTDMATRIKVCGGRFVFSKNSDVVDGEGPFARFFERGSFTDFVIAEIHAQACNEEYADRIRVFCANSSIVCGGIIVGTLIGGPLGGVIGAGLAAPLGILVETQIAGTIQESQLQTQFEEATIGCYLYETLQKTLAEGAAEYLGRFLGKQTGKVNAKLMGEVASEFGVRVTKAKSEFAAYWLLKKVSDALIKGTIPKDWLEIKAEVKELQAKRPQAP
ncbi:hypothetical protein F5X99DRAFT_400150 [Biscogniauxia marginata]|nr:hypothetical protein F5X99DRAFT_400150 [Biscogniauxia marginata]